MGGDGRAILPNAGLPQRVEGQFVYAAGPTYLADMTPRFVAAGAAIVGGCCGTTPEHIAAMRAAIDALAPGAGHDRDLGTDAPSGDRLDVRPTRHTSDAPPPTGILQSLRAKRFVISVEIDPPRSVRIERTIEAARLLQGAGVDAVNISDSAMARVRMGAMAVAFGIQHDLDLECLIHFTTRDRNLMALESELLGAHALGVRNIIALTGDPPRVGDYPSGTGVWDVDSIGLIEILTRLNRGEDGAGSPIGAPAGFTIACALDPTAADAATEWDRLERKIAAGAHLVMTQPLYDLAQVEAMDRESRRRFGPAGFPLPVLLGVLPLQSTPPRGVPPQRGPGHHDPGGDPGRAPGGRGARRGGRAGADPRPPRAGRLARRRHLRHAQLRAVRAGSRARPPAPRPPSIDRRGRPVRRPARAPRPRCCGRLAPPDGRRRSSRPARRSRTRSTSRPSTTRPASSRRRRSPKTEATIDAIEARTGAEVVVYTQPTGYYSIDTDETEARARALIDQWGIGRAGFNDGMVIFFDLDPSNEHGQVQLYAAPGFEAAFLSNSERQAIFENDMLPHLRAATSTAR